jgi:hypothetical protein
MIRPVAIWTTGTTASKSLQAGNRTKKSGVDRDDPPAEAAKTLGTLRPPIAVEAAAARKVRRFIGCSDAQYSCPRMTRMHTNESDGLV